MILRRSWLRDACNYLRSVIIKDIRSSVDIRRWLDMTKTTSSTLLNIWKDRNITRATKIKCYKGVGIFSCALWMWDMGCWKVYRQECNTSLWDLVMEKAAWDIMERSHHQLSHTVPYWQTTITYSQDWSAQAKILVMFAEGQETALEKKASFKTPVKEPTWKGKAQAKTEWWTEGDHSLNTLPLQMPVEWPHIMGHNGSAMTWKWRRGQNLRVETMRHLAFCLPIHRPDRTKTLWSW